MARCAMKRAVIIAIIRLVVGTNWIVGAHFKALQGAFQNLRQPNRCTHKSA